MDKKQRKLNEALKNITLKAKQTLSNDKLDIAYGNTKLGDNTLIINMGTAMDCPASKLGMCNALNKKVKCYALKAEVQYVHNVPDYRHRQFSYWRTNSATKIVSDLVLKISKRHGNPIKYVRFNEAGDFWDQNDITKLSIVAKKLKNFNIVTYGYTSRKDLDFSSVNFLVKGSGHSKGNNGKTTIIDTNESIPEGYRECPGDCKICSMCMTNKKINIAFRKH